LQYSLTGNNWRKMDEAKRNLPKGTIAEQREVGYKGYYDHVGNY